MANLSSKTRATGKLKQLANFNFTRLLSDPSDNPKLAKSLGLQIMSVPLHLAPAKESGRNVCAMATAGCKAACLHTAGNPAFMAAKTRARIARTNAFFDARPAFMLQLANEIAKARNKARKKGFALTVRLNATSDIRWETISVYSDVHVTIFDIFKDVQFYDYTKLSNRKGLPSNYHLTFSLAENNDAMAIEALSNGMNVAAVFDTKRTKPLPTKFKLGRKWYRVIDGDVHDYRPADPTGVIVGLRAKGKARRDQSGFVRKAA